MSNDRAILFLNLGGPEKQKDVKDFLYRLFSDPEIIRISSTPLRKMVAFLITLSRLSASKKIYSKIGGGSPIRRLTDQQAAAAESSLHEKGFNTFVRTAFTGSKPFIEDVVKELAEKGIQNFLTFPLYPQYSLTTTKGAIERTRAAVQKFAPTAKLSEITSWPTHPLFLKAHAELIREEAKKFLQPKDEKIHLVFSAHSIPEDLVTKLGDPYKQQMEQTVAGVLKEANWKGPWTLAWQSKLGPVKWLEPSTEDTLKKLGSEKVQQVLVTPIAFVSDHVETLYELDQELGEEAREFGIREFRRVPGLNDNPTFIAALTDLALQQTQFWS